MGQRREMKVLAGLRRNSGSDFGAAGPAGSKTGFQVHADIDPAIGNALPLREAAIHFQPAAGVIPDGTPNSRHVTDRRP